MTLVAGIDSSTQSCKVVIRNVETGQLVRHGSAPHPGGTEECGGGDEDCDGAVDDADGMVLPVEAEDDGAVSGPG